MKTPHREPPSREACWVWDAERPKPSKLNLDAIQPGTRKLTQSTTEAALETLAATQHGVVTTSQLGEIGIHRRAVSRLEQTGRLHRLYRGVYAIAPPAQLKPQAPLMAAVLASGPGAALAFQSAAAQRRLIKWTPTRVATVIPVGTDRRQPGIIIKRSQTLRATDVELVYGIPTTTVARTLFDLAGVLGPKQIEKALDEAVSRDREDYGYEPLAADLRDQIARNGGRRKEVLLLTSLLGSHASAPSLNDFERLLRDLLTGTEIPTPEMQSWLDLGDGEPMIQPDFLWREIKLIVETDGFDDHGKRGSFESDRERDQRAAAAGFQTVRITWRQAARKPAALSRRIVSVYRTRFRQMSAVTLLCLGR